MMALTGGSLGSASVEMPASGALVLTPVLSAWWLKARLPPAEMRALRRRRGAATDINEGVATAFQKVESLARSGWRRRMVVDEGATNMVLEALPEAASTVARKKVKHGGDKLINGMHRSTSPCWRPTHPFFFYGELADEPLPIFFSLLTWLER
jgi:hypothetical protein